MEGFDRYRIEVPTTYTKYMCWVVFFIRRHDLGMRVETSRFGAIEVTDDCSLEITGGLYGFENCTRYCLMDEQQSSVFRWLQSMDLPELAFVVASPFAFFGDYDIEVPDEELADISCGSPGVPEVLCVVTVGSKASSVTMNLKAPLIIYPDSRTGKQVILQDAAYSTKQALPLLQRR